MLIKLKNKITKSTSMSQQLKLIGITGFFVVLFLNVLAQVYFKQEEAILMQSDWWSVWFPNYIVWFVLLAVGLVFKNNDSNSNSDLSVDEAHSI